MARHISLLVISSMLVALVSGFGGTEEKFIRKYAMMKVYESCFGIQVLREVRKEMKEAALKCSGFQNDFDDKYINHEPNDLKEHATSTERPTRPPRPSMSDRVTRKPIHTADTLLLQQWTEEQNKLDQVVSEDHQHHHHHHHHSHHGEDSENEPDSSNETETETPAPPTRKPLDLSKLEEAILSINRPGVHMSMSHQQQLQQLQQQQRPSYSPPPSSPNYQTPQGYYPPMFYPPPMPYPAAPAYPYSPYYPGYYQPPYNPAPMYSRSGHRSAKITKGFNADKTLAQTESTIAQFSGGARGRTLVPPKDLDVKASIDAMTFHSGSKMRNITCVMQELGYLDEKLEPSYDKMMDRINKLQVSMELKKDMLDGVKFCKQFSQCVPEVRKDKFQLSKELLRPMFFFRCYKHKKLESCIMKDVRDRFAASSTVFEENGQMANELRRSFQKTDLASSIFEFMYGSSADDFESLL